MVRRFSGGEFRGIVVLKQKRYFTWAEQSRDRMRRGEDVNLPLLAYYGAGRLWNVHRNIPLEKPDSASAGYHHCLNPKSDHYLFEKWFKQQETVAVQRRRKIPALELVRKAVRQGIPGATEFFYDFAFDCPMIRMEDGLQSFDRLSDGYRNMVAMIADIAHRAARLNPHLGKETLEKVEGIVLIDEIDLHLHPKWQRTVTHDLRKIFPGIQFIATTHSPFIIQSLQPGEVLDLSAVGALFKPDPVYKHIAEPGPGSPYSHRSIEDIVEEVMGVPIPQRSFRHQRMYEAACEYFQLLEQGQVADPELKLQLKLRLDELSAPFSDDMAYVAYLEMKRAVAGLANQQGED